MGQADAQSNIIQINQNKGDFDDVLKPNQIVDSNPKQLKKK